MPGTAPARAFYLCGVGDRFGVRPWEMDLLSICEFDRMLQYAQKVPSFG